MGESRGRIRALSILPKKGDCKTNVARVELRKNFGILGDAHAGAPKRHVSLLLHTHTSRQLSSENRPEDLLGNIIIENLNISDLKVGMRLKIPPQVILEISQCENDSHNDQLSPEKGSSHAIAKNGVFASVIQGGVVNVNDIIELYDTL